MSARALTREALAHRVKVYLECDRKGAVAALRLGISRGAMENTLHAARLAGLLPADGPASTATAVVGEAKAPSVAPSSSPEPDNPVAPAVLRRLQDEVRRLKVELAEVVRENISVEDVRRHIFKLTEHEPDPPGWMLEPVKGSHGWMTVPSAMSSDLHFGERVSLTETKGINEYNVEVARRRFRNWVQGVIGLCFKHNRHTQYPGLVLNVLGDIVSGGIHQELRETNELTSMEMVLFAVDMYVWAIDRFLERFARILFIGVPGNHGRDTQKPMAKRYVFQNYDWLIYQLLRRHYESHRESRVQFLIPDSGEALYRLYGWRYMMIHGDDLGVKGGDGIIGSAGPIIRGEIKIHNSNAVVGQDYDYLGMGHFHQQFWFPRVIVDNTLKGFCEFARRILKAVPSTPSQALWETHPDHGIINRRDVFVDAQIPRERLTPWTTVFEA